MTLHPIDTDALRKLCEDAPVKPTEWNGVVFAMTDAAVRFYNVWHARGPDILNDLDRLRAAEAAGKARVPEEPTKAMLDAARDWSVKRHGIGVGNDEATGCWKAMYAAARAEGSAK